MDKYRRVPKAKDDSVKPDNEIRVTAVGSVSAYVSFAAKVFNEMEKEELVIKATGNALAKAVTLAEVIKRRFKGLHQVANVSQQEIVDEYEPLEEGLEKVIDKRNMAYLEITLSKNELDTKAPGYQAPLDDELVQEYDAEEMTRSRGRGRGSGRGKGEKGRGKGKSNESGKGKGKSKSKDKSKSKSKDDSPKGKGKGKGKDEKGKGKGKDGKGKSDKGKGKSKSKGKDRNKGYDSYSKGYDSYSGGYDSYSKGKGKGKGKSKGWGYDDSSRSKGGKSSWSSGGGGGWDGGWEADSWSTHGGKSSGKKGWNY